MEDVVSHRRGVDMVAQHADRDRAVGIADEGGRDLARLRRRRVVVEDHPVVAVEGRRFRNAAQLLLQLLDLFVDLVLVDTVFGRGNQLRLDLGDDVDDALDAGIGRFHRRRGHAERILDRRNRLVVGPRGGGDRPIDGIVVGFCDTHTRRDVVLRDVHIPV